MDENEIGVPRGRRYPRVCGLCGGAFVAGRRDARWCSDACRLRAWRQRHRSTGQPFDESERVRLLGRIETLERSLACAQATDVCAEAGCRLTQAAHAQRAEVGDERRVRVAPWRQEDWRQPVARDLHEQVCAQADELARWRRENALLRCWVNAHLSGDSVERAGE